MTLTTLGSLEPDSRELSNGLGVTVVPLPSVHRVVLGAYVRIGSRFECATNNGISHFLEHMLFRGIPTHPTSHQQALAFEKLGGMLVAATAADHGTLATSCPPESFESAMALFGDVFQRPIFDGIEVEKGIVREEINESLDEEGKQVDADNLVRALAFGGHSLALPITGTVEQLERFERESLAVHHRAHYSASSSHVVVAGPIDAGRAHEAVARAFEALDTGSRCRVDAPGSQAGPRFRFVDHASSQTEIRLGFRALSETDPDEPSLEALMRTLDDGMSTRLYHRICDELGLCYDVSAGYEAYEDDGLIDVAAEAQHDRAGAVLDEILSIVDGLRSEGPTPDELDKAKARHRWQMSELLDDPGDVAEFFGMSRMTGTVMSPRARVEQIADVSLEQVREVARRVFTRDRLSVVVVGKQTKRARRALEAAVNSFGG